MNPEAPHPLESLLDRQIDASRQLAAVLLAERTALTGASAAVVEERAAEKVALLETIERLEQERRRRWDGSDGVAMRATVSDRWRSLLDLLATCRTANEVNGHIIRVRQSQIRQLLDIVRGGPAMTYGPQGKTFDNSPRALARA